MDQKAALLTICGMALVTCLPRILPLWLLAKRRLSPKVSEWLAFVPAAVLSALLVPELLLKDQQLNLTADNIFLPAALPAFIVAAKTRSLIWSVIVGVGTAALLRYFS